MADILDCIGNASVAIHCNERLGCWIGAGTVFSPQIVEVRPRSWILVRGRLGVGLLWIHLGSQRVCSESSRLDAGAYWNPEPCCGSVWRGKDMRHPGQSSEVTIS